MQRGVISTGVHDVVLLGFETTRLLIGCAGVIVDNGQQVFHWIGPFASDVILKLGFFSARVGCLACLVMSVTPCRILSYVVIIGTLVMPAFCLLCHAMPRLAMPRPCAQPCLMLLCLLASRSCHAQALRSTLRSTLLDATLLACFQEYIRRLPPRRNLDPSDLIKVLAGREPFEFRCLFQGWQHHLHKARELAKPLDFLGHVTDSEYQRSCYDEFVPGTQRARQGESGSAEKDEKGVVL